MSTYVLIDASGEQVGGAYYVERLAHAALVITPGAVSVKTLPDAPAECVAPDVVRAPELPSFDVAGRRALIAEVDASLLGVTEEPWTVDNGHGWVPEDRCPGISSPHSEDGIVTTDSGHYGPTAVDGRFIAASRSNVPKLRDALAAALDEIERLRKDLEYWESVDSR